eukprot:gene5816-6057_t
MALLQHAKSVAIRTYLWLYDLFRLKLVFDSVFRLFMGLVEMDVVPDFILRRGIRMLLQLRLISMAGTVEQQLERKMAFVQELKVLPIAVHTAAANEQHYEVPTEYFKLVLGPHLKYSCCLYNSWDQQLSDAERNMLALYFARARLQDGLSVLELGCGWGSFSLFMAQALPNSFITAVSNSSTQRAFIMQRAQGLKVNNLQVITADMVDFKYHDETDWMTRYFFSGGTMPSLDLLLYFQQHMQLQQQWWVNGRHYQATLEAWLANQDKLRRPVQTIFAQTYGKDQAVKWLVYWRLFYMACSELFGYHGGEEWGVGHYLFAKPASVTSNGKLQVL